jgi:hypothetical protein
MRNPPWLIALASLVLTGCGDRGPIEVTQVRDLDQSHDFEVPVLAESDMSRFRFSTKKSTDPGTGEGAESGSAKLTWNLPDGWKELPSTSMREPNLRFGENDEGECYVTRLSGGAGGLGANINRWRKQMNVPDLTEEEVAALPKKTLFGQPATFISIDGTFSGMGGAGKENYRLNGLILNVADSMVTVKMTGPKVLVSENEGKFKAFCASLVLRSGNR